MQHMHYETFNRTRVFQQKIAGHIPQFFFKSKLYSVIRIKLLARLIASTEFHTVAPGLSPVCRHRSNIGQIT